MASLNNYPDDFSKAYQSTTTSAGNNNNTNSQSITIQNPPTGSNAASGHPPTPPMNYPYHYDHDRLPSFFAPPVFNTDVFGPESGLRQPLLGNIFEPYRRRLSILPSITADMLSDFDRFFRRDSVKNAKVEDVVEKRSTHIRTPSSNLQLTPPVVPATPASASPLPEKPILGATKVDQLMLVIQARAKGVKKPIARAADGTIEDRDVLPPEIGLVGGIDKLKARSDTKKKHVCEYCGKNFTQTTHLEVHVRSHVGLKPFKCKECGKTFTQGGNLRTHLRSHTGERPFKCEDCGRSFSRKGNLAAHKLTHTKVKPFKCKLENCDKAFTQLGNLKAHQNRFHINVVLELTDKLATLGDDLSHLPKDEREIIEYFMDIYKNSNKGIKGRGKKTATIQPRTRQGVTQQQGQPSQSKQEEGQSVGVQGHPQMMMPIISDFEMQSAQGAQGVGQMGQMQQMQQMGQMGQMPSQIPNQLPGQIPSQMPMQGMNQMQQMGQVPGQTQVPGQVQSQPASQDPNLENTGTMPMYYRMNLDADQMRFNYNNVTQ